MSGLRFPACLLLLAAVASVQAQAEYLRVCYYTNWSQYRPDPAKFFPENIDPSLCSHLVFSFANMAGNRLISYEWNDESTDWMVGMYARFNNLKRINPDVKTLLAVGGWNFKIEVMTAMLSTAENRKEFVDTTIEFLRERNFDGFDLDFEYPGSRGSPPEDKFRFTFLVQELRAAFEEEAARTGRERLILSAATPAGVDKVIAGYELDKINPHLDFVNVMAYDYFGAWDPETGHVAPLYGRSDLEGLFALYNVDYTLNFYADNGIDKEKIIVGVPFYGRGWTLEDPENDNGMGAKGRRASTQGYFTREAGQLAYYEMCEFILGGYPDDTVLRWDPEHDAPYGYSGDQWFGFDDSRSLINKVDYLKNNTYGGWMMWSLDFDDFLGDYCGGTKYPLLKTLNYALLGRVPTNAPVTGPPLSTPVGPTGVTGPESSSPSSGSTVAPPTNPPNGDFCSNRPNGLYADPEDCKSFYQCSNGAGTKRSCSNGTFFNPNSTVCDWPWNLDRDYACNNCNYCNNDSY